MPCVITRTVQSQNLAQFYYVLLYDMAPNVSAEYSAFFLSLSLVKIHLFSQHFVNLFFMGMFVCLVCLFGRTDATGNYIRAYI